MSKPIKCPACLANLGDKEIRSILGAYGASRRKNPGGGKNGGRPQSRLRMRKLSASQERETSPLIRVKTLRRNEEILTSIRQHNNAVYEVGPNEERKLVPFEEIA